MGLGASLLRVEQRKSNISSRMSGFRWQAAIANFPVDRQVGLQGRRKLTLARTAICLLATAGLVGCGGIRSDLDIVNNTEEPVHAVTISDGQTVWEFGELQPKGIKHFDGRLSGEGGPQISWTFRGQRYSERGCYYTASWPGMPAKGAIRIEGEDLSFRCL